MKEKSIKETIQNGLLYILIDGNQQPYYVSGVFVGTLEPVVVNIKKWYPPFFVYWLVCRAVKKQMEKDKNNKES